MHSEQSGLTQVMAAQKLTKGSPSCSIHESSMNLVDSFEVLIFNLLVRIKDCYDFVLFRYFVNLNYLALIIFFDLIFYWFN